MSGKIIAAVIVVGTVIFGAALWWFQTRAYYAPVAAGTAAAEIRVTLLDGGTEMLATEAFEGIDADSSPIRFRACFETADGPETLADRAVPYPDATPLVAPGWFGCFDEHAIAAALEDGSARAFLGEANRPFGVDRVVVVTRTGRGFVWPQINACGEAFFDGNPMPPGCPPAPERN